MLLAGILNHLFAQTPMLAAELAPLQGRTFRVQLPFVAATVVVTEAGLLADSQADAEAILTLPARFFITRWRDRPAASRLVQISGDAELAGKVGNVLAALQWDASEDLSLLLGDVLAERVRRVAVSMVRTPQAMGERMAQTLVEYCRDEQKILPQAYAVTQFCDQVDQLRDDVARLELRLRRLERS